MDIIEALDGPHEWGYRGLAGEGFIHDPAPNNAAREITKLRKELSYRVHTDEDIEVQNREIERLRADLLRASDRHLATMTANERLRAALLKIRADSCKYCYDVVQDALRSDEQNQTGERT